MDAAQLFNGTAAVIVFGGTAVATVMRCGLTATRATLGALADLFRPGFRPERARAALADFVNDIRASGLMRARPRPTGDAALDAAVDALVQTRAPTGLLERHEAFRRLRAVRSDLAAGMLAQGADLAPVLGLAGTLISLTQLPREGLARGAFSGAIGLAVLTTLYGLVLANLVLGPLAKMVERRAAREEAGRQDVIDWLAHHVALYAPRHGRADHPADPEQAVA